MYVTYDISSKTFSSKPNTSFTILSAITTQMAMLSMILSTSEEIPAQSVQREQFAEMDSAQRKVNE